MPLSLSSSVPVSLSSAVLVYTLLFIESLLLFFVYYACCEMLLYFQQGKEMSVIIGQSCFLVDYDMISHFAKLMYK